MEKTHICQHERTFSIFSIVQASYTDSIFQYEMLSSAYKWQVERII